MPTDPLLGADFAGYRIEALLGRGGVGLVYRAQDLRLPRKVAVKILAAELADDESFRERFVRESRLAASIDHPHIVPVYEAGEAEGRLYIAMRHVEGTDLRGLLRGEGPLDAQRAVTIVSQVASALDAAHARGLCHRDVKPANILVGPRVSGGDDHVYLADFGLTRLAGSLTRLTRTGQFVGTVDYASPEQISGEPVDGSTDVYALGCVLYECLAGTPPYPRDSDVAAIHAHLSEPPPRLSAARPDLPTALDGVIATAMARRGADRHPTCSALADDARRALRATDPGTRILDTPPAPPVAGAVVTRGRRVSWQAVLVAGLAVLGIAFFLISRHDAGDGLGSGATGSAGEQPFGTAGSSAAAAPAQGGLAGALLTADAFGAATVTGLPTTLRLADITCSAPPAGEVDEQRVAFQGSGARAGRAYYEAVARFPSTDAATTYMRGVAAATRSCPQRLGTQPPAPHLGDQSVRLLFPSRAGDITYDATYVRSGSLVCVVLVSANGTSPPPADDTMGVVSLAVQRIGAGGP